MSEAIKAIGQRVPWDAVPSAAYATMDRDGIAMWNGRPKFNPGTQTWQAIRNGGEMVVDLLGEVAGNGIEQPEGVSAEQLIWSRP